MVKQKIDVILEYFVKNQERIMKSANQQQVAQNKMRASVDMAKKSLLAQKLAQEVLAKKQQFYAKWSNKLGVNTARVRKIMQTQGVTFDKLGKVTDFAGRKVKDLNSQMKKGRAATKGFKMQWLGVMFAGMAIQRIFGGIIKQQMDLFGITDVFSSMWTVVLLPVMESIMPILLKLAEWFMDLPESTKMWIGRLIIAAAIFGTLLAILGAGALAINSISQVIDDLIPAEIFNDIAIFGFSLGDIAGTLENLAIKGGVITGLLALFSTLLGTVSAATSENTEEQEGFFATITKVFSKVLSWIENIGSSFKGIGSTFSETLGNMLSNTSTIITTIADVIKKGIKKAWDWLYDKMPDWAKEAMDKVKEKMKSYWEDIKNIESIGDVIMVIVKTLTIWGDIGVIIATEMVKGILNHIKSNLPRYLVDTLSSSFKIFTGFGIDLWDLFGGNKKKASVLNLPSYQTGGIMPYTGLAYLHKGERITPANQTNNTISPNITINATISNDYDVRMLADQLKRYWVNDFERASQGRTA